MLSQPILHKMVADSLIMGECCRTALGLFNMPGQKLLMLCWGSLLGHSSDVVANIFA